MGTVHRKHGSVCDILTLDFSYNIEIISIMFSKMAY